jgi:hypothetical protein
VAFDIYAGTLTRYYRRDWENIMQRTAREQGMQYQMVFAGGETPPPAAEEVRAGVTGWCQALTNALQPHGWGPVRWDESDAQPYFTDRPGWEGYTALLLWASHVEFPDLPLPEKLSDDWADDPAFKRASSRDHRSKFHTILVPQMWLPVEFPGVFEGPTLSSETPVSIGSTFTLRDQLDALWSESGAKLAKLSGQTPGETEQPRSSSPAPKKPGLLGRLFGRAPDPAPPRPAEREEPGLAHAAHHGFEIWRNAARHACEHRVPILLDY